MANHLASIFGTEKDRVNCPFYFKIGWVCRRAAVRGAGHLRQAAPAAERCCLPRKLQKHVLLFACLNSAGQHPPEAAPGSTLNPP